MKKVVVLAIAGLTLASVAAYAQMQHQGHSNQAQMHQNHEGKMGPGMMRGGMMHGGMQHGNTASGSTSHGAMSNPQGMQPKGDTGPSSLAFNGINMKMHSAMDSPASPRLANAPSEALSGFEPGMRPKT